MEFETESFDLVVTMSTFEHFRDVPSVLSEIRRVLRKRGKALITFEPVWTCSYGHHLHQLGPEARCMPDWAHLVWDKSKMLAELSGEWPQHASLTLEEAAHWVYESNAINRVSISRMRDFFAQSGLTIAWMVPLMDETRDPQRLQTVAKATAISPSDLMIKGLSVFLEKELS